MRSRLQTPGGGHGRDVAPAGPVGAAAWSGPGASRSRTAWCGAPAARLHGRKGCGAFEPDPNPADRPGQPCELPTASCRQPAVPAPSLRARFRPGSATGGAQLVSRRTEERQNGQPWPPGTGRPQPARTRLAPPAGARLAGRPALQALQGRIWNKKRRPARIRQDSPVF